MKYYAVTEDPRELYHYGVKGMKWGQHLFGDDLRPKSPAYRRAASKLRANLNNKVKTFKATSKVNSEQRAIRRRANEQNRYMKSILKTQDNIRKLEGLHDVDNDRAAFKRYAKEQKYAIKQQRYQNKLNDVSSRSSVASAKKQYKQAKKALRNERRMDKIMQEAREGRLRYGKLSEEQVARVQQRLNMENQARILGGKEKPSWRKQKKEAFRAGKLEGIKKGTSAAMEEVARAGAIYGIQHFMDRRKLNAKAKQEGKQDKIKNREKNKKSTKEMRKDAKQELEKELIETQIKSGANVFERHALHTTAGKAKALEELKERKKLEDVGKQAKLDVQKDTDKEYYKYLAEHNLKDTATIDKGPIRLTAEENARRRQERLKNLKEHDKESEELRKQNEEAKKADEVKKEQEAIQKANEAAFEKFKETQRIKDHNAAEDARYEREKAEYDEQKKAYDNLKAERDSAKNEVSAAEKELRDAEAQLSRYKGQDVPSNVRSRVSVANDNFVKASKKHKSIVEKMEKKKPKKPEPPNYKEVPNDYDLATYESLRGLGLNPYGGSNGGGKGKKGNKGNK